MSASTGSSGRTFAAFRTFLEAHPREVPLAIAMVTLAMHVHFLIAAHGTHLRWDSSEYLASAKSLAAGNGFRDATGALEARRTPGYPLLVAAFMRLGLGVNALVLAQHLAVVGLMLLVYAVTLAVSGDRVAAVVAGLCVGIDTGQIYMADQVMTETAMSVLLFAAVAALARASDGNAIRYAAVGGALLAVAVLVRPAAVYLWIPLTAWILWTARRHRIAAATVFALCALSLPLIWTWRNYERAGVAALSSIVGEDLYAWRAAGAVAIERSGFQFSPLPWSGEEEYRRQFFLIVQRQFVRENAAQMGAASGRRILLEHPAGALMMTLNGALHLIFDAMWEYPNALFGGIARDSLDLVLIASSVISFVLAVVGFVRLRRADWRAASLFAVVLLYFVAVLSGPEHEQWRYRVPLIPLVAVLVGCAFIAGGRAVSARGSTGRSAESQDVNRPAVQPDPSARRYRRGPYTTMNFRASRSVIFDISYQLAGSFPPSICVTAKLAARRNEGDRRRPERKERCQLGPRGRTSPVVQNH